MKKQVLTEHARLADEPLDHDAVRVGDGPHHRRGLRADAAVLAQVIAVVVAGWAEGVESAGREQPAPEGRSQPVSAYYLI